MHSNHRIYCFVFSLVIAAVLAAAARAQVQGGKVGIVNIQDAIASTNEGKKELDALQVRFGPKNNELKVQNDEVEKLKTQLQAQSDKLSEDQRDAQVKTIAEKQKALQRNFEDFQAAVQQAEQAITNRLGAKMLTVLEKYANANGYSVILDTSGSQTTVLWASESANLNKALVDAYNAANPVSSTKP